MTTSTGSVAGFVPGLERMARRHFEAEMWQRPDVHEQ